jgi:hypothetical protein
MSRAVRVGIIVSRFGEDYREEKRREEKRREQNRVRGAEAVETTDLAGSNGANEVNGGLAGRVRRGRAPRGLIVGAVTITKQR